MKRDASVCQNLRLSDLVHVGKFDIRISIVCLLLQKPDSWIEGNTINEILASFAAFLKDDRNVAVDSNALHGLIQCYMKNGSVEDESYDRVLEMFLSGEGKLKNLFAAKDSTFHIPINHPERAHWNFGLILAEKKTHHCS